MSRCKSKSMRMLGRLAGVKAVETDARDPERREENW
jgi:hypothetical protein